MKIDSAKLDKAFNPQCIAVIGDNGKLQWIHAESTFRGKLYSVQINPDSIKTIEALGVKNFASLLDIPEPVDLAVVSVPRAVAPRILEDCIQKGVPAVHFYTSGFSETDTIEGKELEKRLAERAKQAGICLIGPNCMGIFNPRLGVRQYREQYVDSAGAVGFISQSGTHALRFSIEAHLRGVDICKSVSFGNGIVLDSANFLDYFGDDTDIKAIGMYLEGVKDGQKFLSVLKQVSSRKPVVIWKGGRTEEGNRAIASHTGSLAISQAIWDAAIKQCGAIKVRSMDELIDTLAALLYLLPARGGRVGIAGGSGGQSVAISDSFAEAGLKVPALTRDSYDEFATFFRLVGGTYRNPVDTGPLNKSHVKRVLEILERDANIDVLAFLLWSIGMVNSFDESQTISTLIEIKKKTGKPFMLICPLTLSAENLRQAEPFIQRLRASGIPVFYTLERAARALKNALDYQSFKEKLASG